uniref:Catechol O-methyltransferase n=1 Tax=Cyanistes caeruleus TaxID=156563 RepID=A0A8C0V104_CYACU
STAAAGLASSGSFCAVSPLAGTQRSRPPLTRRPRALRSGNTGRDPRYPQGSPPSAPGLAPKHGLTNANLVFMDHCKRCYLRDLRLLESHQLLAEGATILADNVLFPGAPHFLQYAKTCGRYHSKVHRASLEYFRAIPDGIAELRYTGTH